MPFQSIIAVILQPMLASFADNHKNIEMRNIIAPIVLLVIALSAILYLIPGSALFVLFLVVTIFFNHVINHAPNEFSCLCF